MDYFLKSIDYDIWYIVMNGDIIPKKKVEDRRVLKTHEDFDERDKILISKNTRAKHYLFCSLDRDIFNSMCHTPFAPSDAKLVNEILLTLEKCFCKFPCKFFFFKHYLNVQNSFLT